MTAPWNQVSHRGVYTGEFKDGEINGRGKRQYVDGGIYVGEWKVLMQTII